MNDLAILVPSRGRPASVARLARACQKTCRTDYVLHFGFDDDDPALDANMAAAAGHEVTVRPRMGLAPWTNDLAERHHSAAYLASLGDDHLPVTEGWDEMLVTAVEHMGGGFAYPDDWRRVDIPEAVVTTRGIVDALGWMACPLMEHWCIDDVWADLGRGAGCLAFCPHVLVRHMHPNVASGVAVDRTYTDAAAGWDMDQNAYKKWRLHHMNRDIATVASCLNRPLSPMWPGISWPRGKIWPAAGRRSRCSTLARRSGSSGAGRAGSVSTGSPMSTAMPTGIRMSRN